METTHRLTIAAFGLAVLRLCAFVAQAQFSYETNNGAITITGGCPSSPGAVTIPATINGLPVTSIGFGAFDGCFSLTSVVIGNSVTNIGSASFRQCTNLSSITIPNGVTSIGFEAFSGCTSLTGFSVDSANLIYSSLDGVLFDKSQTTLIQCPGGKAGSYSIPNSVTNIEYEAFAGCTSLTNVALGNSVTSIGFGAFWGCTSLTSFAVDSGNPNYSSLNGVLFSKDQTTLIEFPAGKAGSYSVPNGVTTIGQYAFAWCTRLTSVVIGNSVTSFGDSAFRGCTSLTAIVIPNSVTNIGGSAFWLCTSLASITIPNSVTSIQGNAFAWCTRLTSVVIGNSVTRIGGAAFMGCTNLTSISIPNSVTLIDGGAFNGCTSLTRIMIPNSVTELGFDAFGYCTSLRAAYFHGKAPSVVGGDPRPFNNANNVIVYYLPGTAGWGATFEGRPTAMWIPLGLDLPSGQSSKQLILHTTSPAPSQVRVQRSTNLIHWEDWQTVTKAAGPSTLQDAEAGTTPHRFYRGVQE